MSVYKSKKSPYWQYDFQIACRRFYGSTGCTSRRAAEKFEAAERERKRELVNAMRRSAASLLIDDVAARLWDQRARYDADPKATETNLARLVEYFGKTQALTDINHSEARKLVAWRRGHRVKRRGKRTNEEQEALPLISNATVNRSTIRVLERLFAFSRAEGAQFDHEPDWSDLLLPE